MIIIIIIILQNELESLETEFDEEKKQAKELQDRLEVMLHQ